MFNPYTIGTITFDTLAVILRKRATLSDNFFSSSGNAMLSTTDTFTDQDRTFHIFILMSATNC